MQLKDIMTRHVKTIEKAETVGSASRMMKSASVGCLVVTNAGELAGIVTDRDLVVRCLSEDHDPAKCRVGQHMTAQVIIATPSMDILEAVHIMSQREIRRLPVVEGKQLVGLVSIADIAMAMEKPVHDLLKGMGVARLHPKAAFS